MLSKCSVSTDDITIIHKYHANESLISAQEYFEVELEDALEAGCKIILIESKELGEETARWIYIGNFLEKSAIITGLASIVSNYVLPNEPIIFCPMAAFSLLCSGLHSASWSTDPCSKYKVMTSNCDDINDKVFRWLTDLTDLMCCTNEVPVILYKEDNGLSKKTGLLHRALSLIAFTFSAWRLYRLSRFAA